MKKRQSNSITLSEKLRNWKIKQYKSRAEKISSEMRLSTRNSIWSAKKKTTVSCSNKQPHCKFTKTNICLSVSCTISSNPKQSKTSRKSNNDLTLVLPHSLYMQPIDNKNQNEPKTNILQDNRYNNAISAFTYGFNCLVLDSRTNKLYDCILSIH